MWDDKLKQAIINIVAEYANNHRDMWGVDEYVWQNDKAQLDAINLFNELIFMLPSDEEESEEMEDE
jgi:hypothetical protein